MQVSVFLTITVDPNLIYKIFIVFKHIFITPLIDFVVLLYTFEMLRVYTSRENIHLLKREITQFIKMNKLFQ